MNKVKLHFHVFTSKINNFIEKKNIFKILYLIKQWSTFFETLHKRVLFEFCI